MIITKFKNLLGQLDSMREWPVATLLVLSSLFAMLLTYTLTHFSFVYSDLDQGLMWYGVKEFRSGNFHMPRFFGQNYGSMLEALVATPLVFLPHHIAVPTATTLLMLLPYFMILRIKKFYLSAVIIILFMLTVMPSEYFLITTMPRDFVSGLAVTSLALFFFRKSQWWAYMAIGFICILGWSTNHNAAMFGAVLMIHAGFEHETINWKSVLWQSFGAVLAFLIHLSIQFYFSSHPEYIVHQAWEIEFYWSFLLDGIQNLDRHLNWLVPLLHGKGWFYLILFAGIAALGVYQKKWSMLVSVSALLAFFILSLGVTKIHDGYNSIYLPHERMLLALPICIAFYLTKLPKAPNWIYASMMACAFVFTSANVIRLDAKIAHQVDPNKPENGKYQHLAFDDLKADCKRLKRFAKKYDAQAVVIIYTGRYTDIHTYACASMDDDHLYVSPNYERKTWDLRELDQDGYNSIILLTSQPYDWHEIPPGVELEDLTNVHDITFMFRIKGENFNPMKVMRQMNYRVSVH